MSLKKLNILEIDNLRYLIKIKRQNSITKNLRKKDSKIPMCLLNPRKCIKKKKTEFNLLYIFSERVQGIKQSQNR